MEPLLLWWNHETWVLLSPTCRRPTWSADTALYQYQSSSGATSQTVNCWWPGLQCRWSPYLERVAGGDHVSTVFVNVPSASQDIPLREIISWCHSMKLKRCRLLTFLLLLSTFLFLCFSSSLFNIEVALLFRRFLIDWLIDWLSYLEDWEHVPILWPYCINVICWWDKWPEFTIICTYAKTRHNHELLESSP